MVHSDWEGGPGITAKMPKTNTGKKLSFNSCNIKEQMEVVDRE